MVNNNGHNPNGTGNAAVHVNGNGHKPEAAIPAEHELLWDGLTPAVTQKLDQPLNSSLVSQRRGRGGKSFDYLEGHVVITQANSIFGYGGWGYELVGDVTLRQVETVDTETGELKTVSGYTAPVRVTVAGAPPRTDLGVHPVTEETFDGHDTAMKAAVTDGMKRAFRSFGVQFGNAFYGDQSPSNGSAQPQRAPARTRSNGRQSQAQARANGKPAQPQTEAKGRNDAQADKLRKQLFEIATEQGLDEATVRTAVEKRTGKGIDELAADELRPLVEAAADKLREMKQEQAQQAA